MNKGWEATATKTDLIVRQGGRVVCYPLTTIHTVEVLKGYLFGSLRVTNNRGVVLHLPGLWNRAIVKISFQIQSAIQSSLAKIYQSHRPTIDQTLDSFDNLLNSPGYLRTSQVDLWKACLPHVWPDEWKTLQSTFTHPLFPVGLVEPGMVTKIARIQDIFKGNLHEVVERNRQFVASEMHANADYFERVESTPLTEEQRRAAIIDEDHNLLVAGAGSGKTSCVVGKIGYALRRNGIQPHEILALAFGRMAADELENRIQARLGPQLHGESIKVKTFHSLGLEIMGNAEGRVPSLAPWATDAAQGLAFLRSLVDELNATSPQFLSNWVVYHALYAKTARDPIEFKSLAEWKRYVIETGEQEGGKLGYRTLQGELVKSQGELAIADWLYMKGVPYAYEQPYEYQTADAKHRQYLPDFTLPEIQCYLEHYAVDAHGNPPPAFGKKYRASMEWKRQLHAEKGTQVLETTFHEFVTGQLEKKLEQELKSRGQIFRARSSEEVLAQLNARQRLQINDQVSFLQTFIKHARGNQIEPAILRQAARQHSNPARAIRFVEIALALLDRYNDRLAASGQIDFEDMIVKAGALVAAGRYHSPFKLILVDEYQDISRPRAELVRHLLGQSANCRLFAVGDDWQSIYRFAGSDISLFTGFQNYFGATAVNYLTRTFRSNQGIADVASCFVQRNPAQMRKDIESIDSNQDGVVAMRSYKTPDELQSVMESILEEIARHPKPDGKAWQVFLLGRYRFQEPKDLVVKWSSRFRGKLNLAFMTAHSSKGLQADYVVIPELQGGRMGFPSQIVDDPLLDLVMPKPERYEHAEERRLFYVALTRARHRVYLVVNQKRPSAFMLELMQIARLRTMLDLSAQSEVSQLPIQPVTRDGKSCPECGSPLVVRKGKEGRKFMGCSQFPDCLHRESARAGSFQKRTRYG